jgi:hypothetical protein
MAKTRDAAPTWTRSYPHNQFCRPVAPRQRWETRTGMGHAPADPSWTYHQPHVWLEGQDSRTVEFIDVAWWLPVSRSGEAAS